MKDYSSLLAYGILWLIITMIILGRRSKPKQVNRRRSTTQKKVWVEKPDEIKKINAPNVVKALDKKLNEGEKS